MLITKVELENIKSYKRAVVTLAPGTTAISGHNGAGKTTIVEAVGFALFDFLPISQKAFVREGEKFGVVTISLISPLDEREYQVVRRCGSNPAYYVYDSLLDAKVVDQKTDVSDWLKRNLKVENSADLADVFCNALGVPQGTFTQDFLAAPTLRKKKFDELLRVEEYRLAFEALLPVRNLINDKITGIKSRDRELVAQTEHLPRLRDELDSFRQEQQEKTDLLLDTELQKNSVEEQRKKLEELKKLVGDARTAADFARQKLEYQHTLFDNASHRLRESQGATEEVHRHNPSHQLFIQAEAELRRLEEPRRARDLARQRFAAAQQRHALTAQAGESLTQQLAEIDRARQERDNLCPLVLQQQALEDQEKETRLQLQRLQEAAKTAAKLEKEISSFTQKEEQTAKEIAAAESCRPEADQHSQLQLQVVELSGKKQHREYLLSRQQKLVTDQAAEKSKQEKVNARITKLRADIVKVEAVQAEAHMLPELEAQQLRLERDLAAVDSALKTNEEARVQSKGGMCPLLHEQCLNIARSGIQSLEDYFRGQIRQDQGRRRELSASFEQLAPQVERVRKIQKFVEKLEGWYEQDIDLAAQCDHSNKLLAAYAEEHTQIATELETLGTVDDVLAQVKSALARSEIALKRVSSLEAHRRSLEGTQATLATKRQELETAVEDQQRFAPAPQQLRAIQESLNALNDPRQQDAKLSGLIQQAPALEKQLLTTKIKHTQNEQEVGTAQAELDRELYSGLDGQIAGWEAKQDSSRAGHHHYLKHEQVAARLASDAQEVQCQTEHLARAQAADQQAREHLVGLESQFDVTAFQKSEETLQTLTAQISNLSGELRVIKRNQDVTGEEIARLEKLKLELAAVHLERAELEELEVMLTFFRNTVKEAGPYVMKALLQKISLEANTIFGEIMGDRTHQLRWDDDYEVIVRYGGNERRFAQLSGGEQMSAALALRLALLKELSSLDIAFFDEPTQNMDESRRSNLAEQIRRVKGFSQLVVISHDDTFEYGLDSIIRLQKESGETVLTE